MADRPPSDEQVDDREPDVSAVSTPIVGIGASAGGLEALSALFAQLPQDTGLAFLIVQHLDRTHVSFLTEILAGTTGMKVSSAENGVPIEPNRVYVITPNTALAVSDGHLTVTPRAEESKAHMPVDVLFNSLAECLGNRAIGVLLSGTGTDGWLGMEAIKSKGEASGSRRTNRRRSSTACRGARSPPAASITCCRRPTSRESSTASRGIRISAHRRLARPSRARRNGSACSGCSGARTPSTSAATSVRRSGGGCCAASRSSASTASLSTSTSLPAIPPSCKRSTRTS